MAQPRPKKKTAQFQADSALLKELGEALVGQPHIALAELVKNAYDADATRCHVTVDQDEIVVEDNGHGMSEQEFLRYWMTIGTRHKQGTGTSRKFKRQVTGSKGVGRLAAQFLARELEMTTVPEAATRHQLVAEVDWDEAIQKGRLTEAEAHYWERQRSLAFPKMASHGTRIVLRGLKQPWMADDIRDLGRQLWMLQSPMGRYGRVAGERDAPDDFRVKLRSSMAGVEDAFEAQMRRALDNHMATVTGELVKQGGRTYAHVTVSFRSGERHSEQFEVEPIVATANWEIRVFNLSGRQAGGISVQDARDYFEHFGGVLVYDAGFRLPYYGVQQDWLGIEFDHSHRRNRSNLLPERLQVRRGLNDLPSQGRLFGVVEIDTGREAKSATRQQREAGDYLKIQVTRDRLVANRAYEELRDAVRWSLDYYATRQRLREQERAQVARPSRSPTDVVGSVRSLVTEALEAHPDDETLTALDDECRRLARTISKEREADAATQALLAPLASVGMAALALEHDARKELRRARSLLKRLHRMVRKSGDKDARHLADEMGDWLRRAEESRRLFMPLLDEDDRTEVEALSACRVLGQVAENVRPLAPTLAVSLDIPDNIALPPATFAEWSALFQNVLINASNATLDADEPVAHCIGGRTGRSTWVRIHDNGVGVDVAGSDSLFEPFSRAVRISDERRALGLGGMGLGLTIVRMIAERRRAKASFVEPQAPWKTTFQLSWRTAR